LIDKRGHRCEVCDSTHHNHQLIPLDVSYVDGDSYNTKEDNLFLICPNCRAQRN
jgi:hypothetical protein